MNAEVFAAFTVFIIISEEKMKKRSKLSIIIFIIIGILISAGNVFFCLDYKENIDDLTKESIEKPVSVLFDWQSNMINKFINNTKMQLRSYAASGDVLNLLKDPDNPELVKRCQEYTDRFFSNMDNWEGLYVEDWNTKVLCHVLPEKIGMIVRKNDTIEQFRRSMTDDPEGLYFNGAVQSSATGKYVMSFCQMITDENDEPIGIVGAAPFLSSLKSRFDEMDMSAVNAEEYAVINRDSYIYAYHSDNSMIGEEIMDAQLLKIMDGLTDEDTEGSYTHEGKLLSYKTLPGTNYLLYMKCDESKFVNNDSSLDIKFIVLGAAFEFILILLIVVSIIAICKGSSVKGSEAETAVNADEAAVQDVKARVTETESETNENE